MTEKKNVKDSFIENLKIIVLALVIAFFFRGCVYENYVIPSGSMKPTLLEGDFLAANKYDYGYSRYSFIFGIPFFKGRVFEKIPTRGDVVLFKVPQDNGKSYIKRLIGLPGDLIQVSKGVLFINKKPVKLEKNGNFQETTVWGNDVDVPTYIETLPNGRSYEIMQATRDTFIDNTPVFKVPEGHYFMMGDNRSGSKDSRTQFIGFVPAENLIGRASFIFFSLGDGIHFWEIWRWPFSIRWSRMFTTINPKEG